LAAQARKSGRKASELVREAVDALLLGVSTEELKQLDAASKRAEADIKDMVRMLDSNTKLHKAFLAEMAKLRSR
jgi:hypothetical protein